MLYALWIHKSKLVFCRGQCKMLCIVTDLTITGYLSVSLYPAANNKAEGGRQ